MSFPIHRSRRLRQHPGLRRLVGETRLEPSRFIVPLFASHGVGVREPIGALPGHMRWSVDTIGEEARAVEALGIPAVLLFGIPNHRDDTATEAMAADGIVQQAVGAIKEATSSLAVITDVCLCSYMEHGHCGVVRATLPAEQPVGADVSWREVVHSFEVVNDATLELLTDTAVSHAQAGADMVAPSDMMDGRVAAIRAGLDRADYTHVPIMSYSAKYASSFYGPFRDAAGSGPAFGDRSSYQIDPANVEEALRDMALDVEEGADILMVKPALPYLDVIVKSKAQFGLPLAAYQVSGEYATLKAAAAQGVLDEERAMWESLIAIRRAGADMIITYWGKRAAQSLAAS